MKKNSGTSQKLDSFLSPGAPNYREKNIENQKGWSSERVLQPTSSSRRGQASGRTIPSKWDDAARWICSPVSGYANNKSCYAQQQHQFLRRPKSKSGPIVPPGTASYSNFSPTIPLRHGLVVKNLMMGSPFTTGVLAPDALSLHRCYSHDTLFGPPSVSSAPLWSSELPCDPSSPNSQDEKRDGAKNEDTVRSSISKIDKGTQMSPPETENDEHSSPKSSSTLAMDEKNCNSAKLEIRDVQIDNQATVVRWSESYASNKLSSLHGKDLKKSSTEDQASGLDIAEFAESTLDTANFEREEAKIIEWESLQKAKAEAAIRKLEMKLEKKRSSSMDKILNKLRRAQMKAEKMRSLTPVQQDQQVSKTRKLFSFAKYAQIWSPSTCFADHAP